MAIERRLEIPAKLGKPLSFGIMPAVSGYAALYFNTQHTVNQLTATNCYKSG